MAESNKPETVTPGEDSLSGGVEGGRAAQLHGEIFTMEGQDHFQGSPSRPSNKYDSAHSRASALKILESAMHSPSRQLSRKEQSTHANTEQESHHKGNSSSAVPCTNSKSDKGSISGSEADEEYEDASEQPRCEARREARPNESPSILPKKEPEMGIRCHCPFNHHRVSQLYLSATSSDAAIEPPKDVQDHFDSCVWRGCIDTALTVKPTVRESAPSPAPTEDEHQEFEEEASLSAQDEVTQRNADADVETALPVSEKPPLPKRRRDYIRILSCTIVWIVLLIVFCAVIAQHHTPNRTVSLSSKQENATSKNQDQRVEQWHSFSHEQAYTYTFSRVTKEQFDVVIINSTASDSTMSNSTTTDNTDQAQPARLNALVGHPWHQDLTAKTIVKLTNLTVVLNVTSIHTLDLTSLCPTVQTIPKPKPSPVLISYQRKQDSKAIVFVKNLLTCLWFLPICLLSQNLVEKLQLGWLSSNEARIRVHIAAVVVSFLVAAVMALGTEVVVGEIAESRRG
jgi:hypothetical protein